MDGKQNAKGDNPFTLNKHVRELVNNLSVEFEGCQHGKKDDYTDTLGSVVGFLSPMDWTPVFLLDLGLQSLIGACNI